MTVKDKLQLILITYNRKNNLKRTLDQLFEENSPVKEYNLLIIDNNSNDGTEELIQNLMMEHKNLQYKKNNYNIGLSGNIAMAILNTNMEYSWILADDDNYNFSHWEEVESAINNKEKLICVARDYLPDKVKNDLAEQICQFVFLPAGIWQTSLINDTIMRNIFDNIYTIMPHLCIMVEAFNKKIPVRVIDKGIVSYGREEETDVSYSRGNSENELYPKIKHFKFIIGFINICMGLQDIKLRKKCIDKMIQSPGQYKGYKHFYIQMVKLFCDDKEYGYWADVLSQLYLKHQIILIIKTIIKLIRNTLSFKKR